MWDVSKFTDRSQWPDSGPAFMYSMNLGYVCRILMNHPQALSPFLERECEKADRWAHYYAL